MATSDADKVLCSTPGRANFQRISRLLVGGGTRVLREIFDSIHAPSALPTVLGDPAREKQLKGARLTPPQWNCLEPSPGVYGKSTDFDITLLSRLLRTICNLTPPPTGWVSLPDISDHSLAADLVRIKLYHNSVYGHVKESMEVTDDEFLSLWHEISETIVRIAGKISPLKRNEWKKAIDRFLNAPLTPEDERNVQELQDWYREDVDVKKAVKQLEASHEEGMSRVETTVTREMEGVRKEIKSGQKAVEKKLVQFQKSVDAVVSYFAEMRPRSAQIGEQLRVEMKQIREESDEVSKLIKSAEKGRSIPKARVFSYRSDFDEKGVIYALGTNFGKNPYWVNPGGKKAPHPIIVTRSSEGLGKPKDLLNYKKEKTSNTDRKPDSWWCLDLGEKFSLFLTHYTLRHGRNDIKSYLKNWDLQGSHDGENWVVLDSQRNHQWYKTPFKYMSKTWPIEGKVEAFRFFRVFQTGENSTGRFDICLSGMELYGVLLNMSPRGAQSPSA